MKSENRKSKAEGKPKAESREAKTEVEKTKGKEADWKVGATGAAEGNMERFHAGL